MVLQKNDECQMEESEGEERSDDGAYNETRGIPQGMISWRRRWGRKGEGEGPD